MRYIGGKSLLLDKIDEVVSRYAPDVGSVVDLFSGSGVVATNFKKRGFRVIANDALYFSYAINRGTLPLNQTPKFCGLGFDPFERLSNLTVDFSDVDESRCFFLNNYSPYKDCNRMYFQCDNALRLDKARTTIERWRQENRIVENEYFCLLSALISATPSVSNITGTYGAYLKHWDARTRNPLRVVLPEIVDNGKNNCVYCQDANELASAVQADLAYIDPPYNGRQYLPNYHVLETLARYDYPSIKGVTGMRDYSKEKSIYCNRIKALAGFNDLFSKLDVRYLLVSYNTEGLLTRDEIAELLKRNGKAKTFRLFEFDYRRYKNKIPNNKKGLKELLFFIERDR
jgi:adenine-specific DNA-methyltransferase